ncbi:MAG: methyltransferase domain-containing protein [Planctomycetota bacterium]
MSQDDGGQSTSPSTGYLHGYSKEEQDRLLRQAEFLEFSVYEHLDLGAVQHLLEVGCGVGAQTRILLRRFPHLHITAVDGVATQIEAARATLMSAIAAGRVELLVSRAEELPFPEGSFDGAFLCWLLEHVGEPLAILSEVRRALRPGGTILCTEVQNATFFLDPYSPATQQYWLAFNDHQWNLHGDPFVGAKLGNLLIQAGYQQVQTFVRTFHYDARAPKKRKEFITYWSTLLLSGAPSLLAAGRVSQALIDQMTEELERLAVAPDSVIFYSYVQAKAEAR